MLRGASDVLVVGAGPAGSAAAVTLARAGLDVVVVDRARFPRPKTCGDALSNSALAEIARMGAGAAIDATPHADVLGALASLPDGNVVRRSYGDKPGRIVPRLALDHALRDAAERAGARVVEGVAVRELVREGKRVVGAAGDALAWRARAVVAADGPGSVAWAALGEKYERGRSLAVSLTAYYEGVAPREAGWSEHHFDADLPYGYGWIFPPVEGVANVGVYQRVDAYRARGVPLAALFERFREKHADRFRGAKIVGKAKSWSLPLAAPWLRAGCPGLVTCGDSGRHVDPLTGEGIWQALVTGGLAGEAVVAALAKGELDDAAVRRYARRCLREVDGIALVRGGVQEAMQRVIAAGLHRTALVRAALQWGYGSGSLEVSKRVGGG